MKLKLFASGIGLVLMGLGCNQAAPIKPVTDTAGIVPPIVNTVSSTVVAPTSTSTTKLVVARSFTLDEIEANGGLKNWFRDLARANVAGKKILVQVPINHVFGFGCTVPTPYCVSTETTGCFGPFVNLQGDLGAIKKTSAQCETACRQANDTRCTQEFRDDQCSTLWAVEGYVTAANRLPAAKDDGTPGTCADGELAYDFKVTRVIEKIAGGYSDEFEFIEYK